MIIINYSSGLANQAVERSLAAALRLVRRVLIRTNAKSAVSEAAKRALTNNTPQLRWGAGS